MQSLASCAAPLDQVHVAHFDLRDYTSHFQFSGCLGLSKSARSQDQWPSFHLYMDFEATVAPLLVRFSVGSTVILSISTSVLRSALTFFDSGCRLCDVFSDARF